MAPISYSFALIIYVMAVNVAFLNDAIAGPAYWIALVSTVLTYGVAIHYKIFKRYFDGKNPYLRFIN